MTEPTPSIEEILQAILDVYFSAGAQVSVDTYNKTHAILTAYTEAVRAGENDRRDKIEHAVEQSIIDQHVTLAVAKERKRIEEWIERKQSGGIVNDWVFVKDVLSILSDSRK